MSNNKLNKYYFYIPNKKIRIQIGFYNLFFVKHHIDLNVICECLDEFGLNNGIKKRNGTILEYATVHFDNFLKIVTAKTGIIFKKRPYSKKTCKDSYSEWYDRASLDGTLAYNGVADDF